MHDPHDRDRQQRELTEELRQDAHRRAERKRRAAAWPEPPAGALHGPARATGRSTATGPARRAARAPRNARTGTRPTG